MAIAWTDGTIEEIPVQWMRVTTTIPVTQERGVKLEDAEFRAVMGALGSPVHWDNFFLRYNLFKEERILFAGQAVFIPIPAGTTEIPVYGALQDCELVAAHIFPKDTVAGDTVLSLVNTETSQTICTYTGGAVAYRVVEFTEPDFDYSALTATYGLRLEVTGTAIPDLVLIIEGSL